MQSLSALAALVALLTIPALGWAAKPINIVAAENFYGDVAQQIAGPTVKVTSILNNPRCITLHRFGENDNVFNGFS